jgi:hypothetical protein
LSYRDTEQSLAARITDIERRLRAVEQPGCCPPDRGWVLTQVGTDLHYLYVPTGNLGPVVGSQ